MSGDGMTGYLERHGRPEHPDELIRHNCLIYSRGQSPDNWSFRDAGGKVFNVKVKGNLRSDTGSLLMNAALNSAGIMMAATFMVSSALKHGHLETVLDNYIPTETALYALYPQSKLVSKKVRVLVDYLAEAWRV